MAIHAKINVNEASKEELMQIPGVNEAKAEAILEFRASHGHIADLSELAEAEQIRPRDLDLLREWLTAGEEEEEEEIEEGEEGEEEEEEW